MLGYSQTLRHAQLDQIQPLVDGGGAAGSIEVYSGTQPLNGATPAVANLVLCQFSLAFPSFGSAVNDAITAGAIADTLGTVDASPTGQTATWFRVTDSNGAFILDGTVGLVGSGAEMEMPTTLISENLTVSVSSYTHTSGNLGLV